MVERWNIDFQKDNSHFNFIVNPAGGGTINPTLHYPRTQYSTIPLFHHSNCERSELLEATKIAKHTTDHLNLFQVLYQVSGLYLLSV